MRTVACLFRARFSSGIVLAALLIAFTAHVPVVGDPLPKQDAATQEVATLWNRTCDAIVCGRFDQGTTLIQRYLKTQPDKPEAKVVSDWLGDQAELQRFRSELRQEDYERHVSKAKKYAEKQKWLEALIKLEFACDNAADKEEFCQLDWVKDIVAKAETEAARLQKESEWTEARVLYKQLSDVFTKNAHYREALKECHNHVRLAALYGPKSEWRDAVRGIESGMVVDTLGLIERSYVDEPDLKKAVENALKDLLQLAESEDLKATFPELKDPGLVEEFTVRIQGRLSQINGTPQLDQAAAKRHFERVLEINDGTLQLPREVLIAEFMEGMLSSMDKFSSMIWPSEMEEFRKHTVGEFSGIGIQIHKEEGLLRVVSPLEDTPAYKADIRAGDAITKIDGKTTAGITLNQAVQRITGPEGTNVMLTIRRGSAKKERDYVLTRAAIKIHTVKGARRDPENKKWQYMYDSENRIGYVRVTSFMENTVAELKQALIQLENQDARGLVLDLRFNPGGLLRAAVETADLFLSGNVPIVSTKGRASEQWGPVRAHNRDSHPDIPLIVLTNSYSASASEIVSGALQDHGRALILGERTFGKGSVQNLFHIGDNTAYLKLTTALYYLPLNRSIHRKNEDAEQWGVDPDVEFKILPQEIRKVVDMRRDADIIRGPNHNGHTDAGPASQEAPLPEKQDQQVSEKGKKSDDANAPEDPPTSQKVADAGEKSDDNDKKGEDAEKEDPDAAEAAADLEEEEKALAKWPKVDPQLEAALLIMRVRLLSDHTWKTARAQAG